MLFAEPFVDVEAELGELQGDRRFGLAAVDRVEAFPICLGGPARLLPSRHALPEEVQGDAQPRLIQPTGHTEGVRQPVSGHEPKRYASRSRKPEENVFEPVLLAEKKEGSTDHAGDAARRSFPV